MGFSWAIAEATTYVASYTDHVAAPTKMALRPLGEEMNRRGEISAVPSFRHPRETFHIVSHGERQA